MGSQGRIFINDNILSHHSQRGVARCFQHLADGIIAEFGERVVVCSPLRRAYGKAKYIPALPRSSRVRGSYRLGINRVLPKLSDPLASAAAKFVGASIIYSPYYGELRSAAADVFIVHDMIHELFPQYFGEIEAERRAFVDQKRRCLERAAAIATVSQSTANDITRLYPHIPTSKIRVVHHGVSEFFFQSGESAAPQGKPYFLYVGDRLRYKNFGRLVTAFVQAGLAAAFDLRVISPVGSSFTPDESRLIDKHGLAQSVRLCEAASEAELRASYRHASAFVCPSEYEGFGLPLLEAMASGTLVVASNTSSMPEVGGDAIFYFDPYNPASIAGSLREVADLPTDQRAERMARGILRARTFSWANAQQKTVQLLKEL